MAQRTQVELSKDNVSKLNELALLSEPPLSLTFIANKAIKEGISAVQRWVLYGKKKGTK